MTRRHVAEDESPTNVGPEVDPTTSGNDKSSTKKVESDSKISNPKDDKSSKKSKKVRKTSKSATSLSTPFGETNRLDADDFYVDIIYTVLHMIGMIFTYLRSLETLASFSFTILIHWSI